MPISPRILIMGAINQDEVARVRRHPEPGETVVTPTIDFFPGGKGANQAAAAASAGFDVSVQLLGAIGDDAAGDDQLRALGASGVDTSLVRRVIGTPTGRAYITVSDDGENTIVVGLGANAFVSLVNLNGALPPDVVVGQTEIGSASIDALAEFAAACGARFVLNNAPVVNLRAHTLKSADPLVLNELEASETLSRYGYALTATPIERATALLERVGCRSVIVTLGAAGCVVADSSGSRQFDAVRAPRVVDTTGAGDSFVGVLAAALAASETLNSAIGHAANAASAAVAWRGARSPVSSMTHNFPKAALQAETNT